MPLAAIRRLAYEAADSGLLSPEQTAGIRRVKGAKKLGVRLANWLLANEARALWELPDAETLKGKIEMDTGFLVDGDQKQPQRTV